MLAKRIKKGELPVAYSVFHDQDVMDILPTITTVSAQVIDKKTSVVIFEVNEGEE